MFGISGTELIIILFFGFLIFGPEKLPQMGRTVGRAIRQFKDASEAANKKFKEQVADPFQDAIAPYKDQMEESTKPLQEDIAAINSTLNETKTMFTDPFKDIFSTSPKKSDGPEKAGAVISTGVAIDETASEQPDNPEQLGDSESPRHSDSPRHSESPCHPEPPRHSERSEESPTPSTSMPSTLAQDDDVASSPAKKSLAASLYDLDDEDGE